MAPEFTDTPIEYVKGIGPKRAEWLQRQAILGLLEFGSLRPPTTLHQVDQGSVLFRVGVGIHADDLWDSLPHGFGCTN